ncbi:MAG: sigma-54-dependent Fis family transcriptional regulator [Desulfobacteraceae bacterium]|nr:MAG: sigma-54-dependent Fis family transcriptional regulator [Desulfobacteraceae bacterium]
MTKLSNILIIDDDDFFNASLSDFLSQKGFRVQVALNGKQGIEGFEAEPGSLVLLDQELPDQSGVEVCKKILEINSATKIIFMSAYASIPYAVEAMLAGAFHYLSKPFELEELLLQIKMAAKNVRLEGKLRVQDYQSEKEKQEKKLIGSSDLMKRIREQIKLAASSDAHILITGETGVGKNVIAREISQLQPTRKEPFLTINCAAIPENLMESEYFGYEKGVFTGADQRREGIFELADGGTLVLDEISEIPMHLQSKLLTVLEERCIRRIGGRNIIPIDVKIIATTNQPLEAAIKNKTFRQDLYYRLAVFNIHVPSLRQHSEDIPELAEYFIHGFSRTPLKIPEKDMEKMVNYTWPGNVRELRNIIERSVILRLDNEIKPANLLTQKDQSDDAAHGPISHSPATDFLPIEKVIAHHIKACLKVCNGNKSLAARKLGISLSTLKRKLNDIASN